MAVVSPTGEECVGWPGILPLTLSKVAAKLLLLRETFYSTNHKNNIAGACSWVSPANPIFRLSPWIKGGKKEEEEEEQEEQEEENVT